MTRKQKFWAALLALSCLAFGVLAVARNVDWGQMEELGERVRHLLEEVPEAVEEGQEA